MIDCFIPTLEHCGQKKVRLTELFVGIPAGTQRRDDLFDEPHERAGQKQQEANAVHVIFSLSTKGRRTKSARWRCEGSTASSTPRSYSGGTLRGSARRGHKR